MMWTKVWEESVNGYVFLIPNYRVFVFCHGKTGRVNGFRLRARGTCMALGRMLEGISLLAENPR